MINVVTFDVGGTLVDGRLDRVRYIKNFTTYIRSLGCEVTESNCQRTIDEETKKLMEIREKGLEMRFENFYSNVLTRLGVEPRNSYIERIRIIYCESFPQTEKTQMRALLKELHGKFKLGIISNSMSQVPKIFLEQNNLIRYFDAIVISGAVGFRKPNPRIFNYALERLNADPCEAVHVGDSFEEDIVGAKNVGMKAIWICEEKLIEKGAPQPDFIANSLTDVPRLIKAISEKEAT